MGILPMMYASLSLLILGSLGKLMALASGIVTSHNPGDKLSGATLDGCRTSCGNLSFNYPFGIGSRCSHGPDFDLTCNETVGVDSPRLFFRDGLTEVIDNIDVITDGNYYGPHTFIRTSFFRTIPMKSGVRVYHMPFKPPGSSFTIGSRTILNITGCDLDVYLVDADKLRTLWVCRTVCPDQGITEMVATRNCNGFGCCRVQVLTAEAGGFHFKFVQGHNKSNTEARSNQSSQLWDRISVTTDRPSGFWLLWSIRDQPTCVAAMRNRTTYACVSKHTECVDSATYDCSRDADTTCIHGGMASTNNGYNCICDIGYEGNPYVLDGCSNDKGYNPVPSRTNCTRWCGNISVQFPFGLEDGCFAREQFHLNCTNTTSSAVLQRSSYQVIDMNISEGTIKFAQFDDFPLFADFELYVKWAAANLSCLEAEQNRSGYACVSMNSKCVAVNAEDTYVGYHCKCLDGFQGNPYVQSGCRDVDECREPNICQGICHNTEGSFYCTNCPPKTEYDAAKMRCTTTKQQILLLGIIIGLSCGFSILILSFSTLFLIRRRNKYIQNKLRKEYFRKNQGLLLETLISSDETANDRTKIFLLEELEKATNNFDSTRIIGRGGHGMVYKGMLSDQRVVAIKKSKVIEQCEISQFINEVAILTQINHRNIVKLFGCCLETEVPLLVYDYVSSGSLSEVLHAGASNGLSSLPWGDYLRIALETAGALSYLHSSASISIFHRDVKSSNILLDVNYTAKVSDFGASRLVPIDQTHIVTNVQGTFGYLDPEYFHTRQLNGKSDVYSFGVVLVELLLRMKHVFTSESGTVKSLSNYFLQEFNEGRITGIVNAQVLQEATEEEINSVASLAERCLRLHGEERPTMKHVEMELQTLQTKRMNSSQADLRNEEPMQPS